MNQTAASSVQSADRLFRILELLSLHPKGIALGEICTHCALPKATVSRMLSSLMTNGYAVQDPQSRKYRLTMRMFEIGSRVADSSNLLSSARPYLEALAQETGETVHLVTRIRDEVVYLYKEEGGSSVVRMASSVGLRNPMYCTGVGKSILAHLPEEEVRAIWRRTEILAYTPNTVTKLPALLEQLQEIRRRGYALDLEEHEPGIRCIAAPILNLNGAPIAAISLCAAAPRMNEERIAALTPLLLETAQKISRSY